MAKYEFTIGKELDLKKEQAATLSQPSLPANFILRAMFATFDIVYGAKRTLPKFMVLEMLARYPYWAWEDGGYKALSRLYAVCTRPCPNRTRELLHLIDLGRASQDNEQWHLLLLADIVHQNNIKLHWFHHVLIPTVLVFIYNILSRLIFWINPAWSFSMNAAFESHAEHQYMLMAQENPMWDSESVESDYFAYYPRQKSLGDLIRRISLDERDHMYHSLVELEKLR
ncbi:MAG: hypothetical protein HGA80_02010 [Candidatus Omnitrophica bacterium]|nr:hypothetical protein [Candidatus Omnitrophota bacterium]